MTCFVASYLIVLALEVARFFWDAALRKYLQIGLMAAGFFAHTAYLIYHGNLEVNSTGVWLSSWFGWFMATAWVLAAAYLWVSIRQSRSLIGVFILPLVLILIGVGYQFESHEPFTVGRAKTIWDMVHGSALLLGTAVVALGFVFGVMYLIQARRLKRKVVPSKHFRLPSLEWLQRSSEVALVVSTVLLAVGLVSGLALNLINRAGNANSSTMGTIEWSDPVVWSSAILFLWLLSSAIFNACYRPARQGRKVAYLVVTSFLFLVLELGIVWKVGHGVDKPVESAKATSSDALSDFDEATFRPISTKEIPS